MIDRRLYLPETSWCDRPDRLTAAGVPDQVGFATKPALARQMIAAAMDAGVPAAWVTGDEVYGADPGLRADLEHRRIGYVLAVGCDRRVHVNDGRTLIRSLLELSETVAALLQDHGAKLDQITTMLDRLLNTNGQ